MKKIRNIMLVLIILFTKNVNAVCDYAKEAALNSEATTIKAIYEEQSKERDKSEYVCGDGNEGCVAMVDYFKISILNLSENFYVTVKGDNNFNKTFTSKDAKDGVISFDVTDISEINTYTFNVYNSSSSGCEKLNRTFYLTTPRLNDYYEYAICEDIPDYYMCQKFVTFDDNGLTDFITKANEYKDNQDKKNEEINKSFWQRIGDFIVNNKVGIIVGVSIIAVITVVSVIIIRKRRKDII